MMRNAKGQNMIEYVLLVTAVLLVCIYFFTSGGSVSKSPMAQALNASLNSMVNQISVATNAIQLSP